jgi:mycoredoxin
MSGVTNAIRCRRSGRNRLGVPLVVYNVTMESTSQLPTVFTTSWCGYCVRLKSQLGRAGIEFHEVDIEKNTDAAVLVAQVNSGNLTVPTVLFPDGSALTNPTVAEVGGRLATAA